MAPRPNRRKPVKPPKRLPKLPLFPDMEDELQVDDIEDTEPDEVIELKTGAAIPLEVTSAAVITEVTHLQIPDMPSRWENARDAAKEKNVFPSLLRQIRRVQALEFLTYIASM